jgi:hypothetical protein
MLNQIQRQNTALTESSDRQRLFNPPWRCDRDRCAGMIIDWNERAEKFSAGS